MQRGLAVDLEEGVVHLAASGSQHGFVDGAPEVGRNELLAFDVEGEASLGFSDHFRVVEHRHPGQDQTPQELRQVILALFGLPAEFLGDSAQQLPSES